MTTYARAPRPSQGGRPPSDPPKSSMTKAARHAKIIALLVQGRCGRRASWPSCSRRTTCTSPRARCPGTWSRSGQSRYADPPDTSSTPSPAEQQRPDAARRRLRPTSKSRLAQLCAQRSWCGPRPRPTWWSCERHRGQRSTRLGDRPGRPGPDLGPSPATTPLGDHPGPGGGAAMADLFLTMSQREPDNAKKIIRERPDLLAYSGGLDTWCASAG